MLRLAVLKFIRFKKFDFSFEISYRIFKVFSLILLVINMLFNKGFY